MTLPTSELPYKWKPLNSWTYFYKWLKKYVTITPEDKSDGATYATDIRSDAWGIHDVLCNRGTWDDGTLVSNFHASTVIGLILLTEGIQLLRDKRWWEGITRIGRSVFWWWATFLFGGGKCRENGMIWAT